MSDERQFLRAIDAQPEDRTTRLVYADWLTEHDDARGELIRVVEEIRTAPIHSDRYWELKPRRKELLKSAKKPWLKRMGYEVSTDYQPVFTDVPAGWKERWRLLREFIERWHEIPMGDAGGPFLLRNENGHIDPAMYATIPPALREWHTFFHELGRNKKIDVSNFGVGDGDTHDAWCELQAGVSFLHFNGGRYHCTVNRSVWGNPDPPVEYGFVGDPPSDTFPSLTSFAFHYLLSSWRDEQAGFKEAIRVPRTKTFARQLAEFFPHRSTWDGIEIFERTNLVAFTSQVPYFTGGHLLLHVIVRQPATDAEVPAFIMNAPRGPSLGFNDY
jgi:uncharacterized protein (TIGR02996 family)